MGIHIHIWGGYLNWNIVGILDNFIKMPENAQFVCLTLYILNVYSFSLKDPKHFKHK